MANQLKLWVNKRTLGAVGVVLLLAVALLVLKGLSGGSPSTQAATATGSPRAMSRANPGGISIARLISPARIRRSRSS